MSCCIILNVACVSGITNNCFQLSFVKVLIRSKTVARVPRYFDKFSNTKHVTVNRYYHLQDGKQTQFRNSAIGQNFLSCFVFGNSNSCFYL